jgi:hypothetical protein
MKNLSQIDLPMFLLFTFFSVSFIFLIRFLVWNISRNKKLKERMKVLEENKCKGPHTWIQMSILGTNVHVCKECRWSAKLEAYVKESFVSARLEEIKFDDALEEYKKEALVNISEQHGLDIDATNKIYKQMISIKKDFVLGYLDKKLEEMKGE